MSRRTAIAEAAVEVIASDGLRGLTHRAVDRRLGIPEGTTSRYARTRHELVGLVVAHLAERTEVDVVSVDVPPSDVDEAADLLFALFERLVARDTEVRARFALTVALVDDPELHGLLTTSSPVRSRLLESATSLLAPLGVDSPRSAAVDLVGLLDGLLYDHVAGSGRGGSPVNVRRVLTAWLEGVAGR